MKKTLIACALATLPVAAMASTIYGTLSLGIEAGRGDHYSSNSGVRDYSSIIGFKGQEDMGNGLKTIWQIETQFDASGSNSASNTLANRQTFVGLDGNQLGKIRLGYLNSAIKDQFQVDQWQYSGGMNNTTNGNLNHGVNGLAIMTNSSSRLKNAVRYDTADFNGFSANVEYGFGENRDKSQFAGSANNVVGLGVNYASPYGVAVHYGYQRETNPTQSSKVLQGANQPEAKAGYIHYLEADYKANNLFVGLAYTQSLGYGWENAFATRDYTQAGVKTRQAALSVAYTIGAFTPKATYAKGWNIKRDSGTVKDSGYSQYILGVDYALSKRTTTELAFGTLRAGGGSSFGAADGQSNTYRTLALSMAHSF